MSEVEVKANSKASAEFGRDRPLADSVPDLLCALNIENVQYGAVGGCLTGATGNGSRQQTFQLFQVVDFCPNVIEMMRGDFADFTTSGFLRSTKPKQGADFVK